MYIQKLMYIWYQLYFSKNKSAKKNKLLCLYSINFHGRTNADGTSINRI